jgi:archaellum component FlaG (FlaF/FlaG flagellin family)
VSDPNLSFGADDVCGYISASAPVNRVFLFAIAFCIAAFIAALADDPPTDITDTIGSVGEDAID